MLALQLSLIQNPGYGLVAAPLWMRVVLIGAGVPTLIAWLVVTYRDRQRYEGWAFRFGSPASYLLTRVHPTPSC